jgi:hypothetical protein
MFAGFDFRDFSFLLLGCFDTLSFQFENRFCSLNILLLECFLALAGEVSSLESSLGKSVR